MKADHHITAVKPATGHSVTWARAGTRRPVFFGEPSLVAAANELCHRGEAVSVGPAGPWVVADRHDPLAALAVLRQVCGGTAEIIGDIPRDALAVAAGVG